MTTGKNPVLVCASDLLSEAEFRAMEGAGQFDIRFSSSADRDWLAGHLPEADAYWATLKVPLDAELIQDARSLRVIATSTTGTDHLDLDALAERNIPVISLKKDTEFLKQVPPTAELTFALLLACVKRLPECMEATRQGYWGRNALSGRQISGKTLGIVGVGRLGHIVAEYARAFRLRILGCDPSLENWPDYIEPRSLDDLLAESDYVTVHVHLTEETRGLIGEREFSLMKKGAVLINTSRGGLVDERALLRALESGKLSAAGLDVIDGEWLPDKWQHPLIAYSRRNPNLIITPHVAGMCPEAVLMTGQHTLTKLCAFFAENAGSRVTQTSISTL